jgi:hypothetical protein
MSDLTYSPAERRWIEAVLKRYCSLARFSAEELERKLEEVRRVAEDPFDGLAENTHEGYRR